MNHTPGPWKYRHAFHKGEPCGIVITPMGYDLSTSNPDENEANAKLISASPELLERLEDCVGVLQSFEDQLKGKSYAVTDALANAREAIAKAKGISNG